MVLLCKQDSVVLDPYSKSIFNSRRNFGELAGNDDTSSFDRTWPQAASIIPGPDDEEFDWEGDAPLGRPMEDLIIYEAHVRGFTANENSNVDNPGKFSCEDASDSNLGALRFVHLCRRNIRWFD